MFFVAKMPALQRAVLAAILLAAAPAVAHQPVRASPTGEPGKAGAVTREIAVTMAEKMRFLPSSIAVRRGETVRFVVKNDDIEPHEFMLGEIAALQQHAAHMRLHPTMQHDEPNAITLLPGQSGALVWRFTHAGIVDFACLIPGHFEAGMKGDIEVTP